VKSRVQDDAIVVLQKPLRAEELLQQVRAALMQE
jgi:hypothetical protein